LVAWSQAHLLADIAELCHTPTGYVSSEAERVPMVDEEFADELRPALHLTRKAADDLAALAIDLADRLPAVLLSLAAGTIDLRRARVICDGTSHLDQAEARAVADMILAEAGDLTTGEIAARLRRLCLQADPEAGRRRYEAAVADRHVYVHPNPEGTGDLYGVDLPADRLAAAMDHLNRLARSLPADGRTFEQRRADLLLDLLAGLHQDGSGKGGTADIRVDLTTLAGLNEQPGEIPGWGPVLSDIARNIADRASSWQIVVTDPETGLPVYTGTTRRRPTAADRRRLLALMPTCAFPGCRMPAAQSDIDHILDYSRGGPTALSNNAPLCRHDHGGKTSGRWKLAQPQPQTYVWTSPHGHTYVTRARAP
jgi:hypothetical protein